MMLISLLNRMSSPADRQQWLCNSCKRTIFGRDAWRRLWQISSTKENHFTYVVTRATLLASVVKGCHLCRDILETVPGEQSDDKIQIMVDHTMPEGVRPVKLNELVLVIGPPASTPYGTALYFGLSAKPGKPHFVKRYLLGLSLRNSCC